MAENTMFHDGNRRLQDQFDSRRIADRLVEKLTHTEFTESDRAFIEGAMFFFLATSDARGQPDCSFKGGMPGFVKVIGPGELAFPDYDGNGMYRTWGNVRVNPHVGLLFLDFENPRRLRVNGSASIALDDPLRGEWPGCVFVVRIAAERIFPNCPRYLHRMQLLEHSAYAPRPDYTPPVPAWKTYDSFRDALPARDRGDNGKE